MEPKVFNLKQIKGVLETLDPVGAIEEGFVAYSEGKVVVPPVGELIFENPPGETHIKYGYAKEDEYYVIKIASGFYNNKDIGLPTTSGMMLLFRQKTGQPVAILLDEGYLTCIRTAAAGAVAAKYLAPRTVKRIGVFGAGNQGRLQVRYLESVVSCRDVLAWGLNRDECDRYKKDMEPLGYNVQTTLEPGEVAENCNLIIMATPSKKPLLMAGQVKPGTHITAMGSDTSEKNELDPHIIAKADIVVGDSLEQCKSRGEIFKAVSAGVINMNKPVELGNVIKGKAQARTMETQITIADLTGVAVQDIRISTAVYNALTQ